MKLLITTQVYENYGAHDWDGVGQCPQYWKAKGGSDYVVKNFEGGNTARTTAVMMSVRDQVECYNDHFRESIIDFRIVADDYLTEYERSQLDYEGKITYPATEILVDSLVD